MKTPHYIFLFCLIYLSCFSQNAIAQIPAIDSLKIISENDETKVVCYTTFPSGSCTLVNYNFSTENNTITLNLNFTIGAATYICHSIDTLSMGVLDPGNYTLEANLTIDPEEMIVDQETILFIIEQLNTPKIVDLDFSIYPNPFQNELSIAATGQIKQVEIISIFGQKVLSTEILTKTIDVSNLEEGIYFIQLTDSDGNQISRKVLKTK